MGAALGYLLFSRMEYSMTGVGLAAVWLMAGRLTRSASHLVRRPADLFLLPLPEPTRA